MGIATQALAAAGAGGPLPSSTSALRSAGESRGRPEAERSGVAFVRSAC